MLLPLNMCTVFILSCTYMIVNIITVTVLPGSAATTTTIITVNNFTIKPTAAANETISPAEPTTAKTHETTTSAITTSTNDTTMAPTEETTTAALTTFPDATTTASTEVITTSHTTTSPDKITMISTEVKTTSPTTTSPNASTTASTQVTTTSSTMISPDATTTASTQVTTTSHTTSSPDATTKASTQVTTTSPTTISPDATTTASTQVTTTSPTTTSIDATTTASTQVTTTSPTTTFPDKTTTASIQVTTASFIPTSPDDTTTASTPDTTTLPTTTSPDAATTIPTQVTTTSALTTSPDETTAASTQETTTSALTTFPDETTTASTQETTISALITSPYITTMASTVETTTSALTTSPDETTMASTVETTTSALTTSPEETTMASTVETTTSALTTSPDETTMASTMETTTSALTAFPDETTTASTQETTTSASTTSPDETTTASTQKTTRSALITSPYITTMASTLETTTSALTTSPDETTMASTVETTTSAFTMSSEETTMASTVETTTSALTTSHEETTMASTVETTTSTLTTFPNETTAASTEETTTSASTTSPDETTTASTQKTTTSALITSPYITTMASTLETTTSALTTSLNETTMTSTVETTSPLSTSPEETTMASTVETTTSVLTTSPEETTMASTVETTTSALTTFPDETTTVSTQETTTSALTTFPDETTTASTQETTTYFITTSPDETTMISTQETTTSANCTSPDITTTYKFNTETTKQLTTSSPLKITMTTRGATAYCPEEILNNIIWSQIVAGQKDTQKCPPGYTGNAFRKCNDNGDWEAPVYIQCVNMALYETSEKLNNIENITDPKQATEVIDDVLNTINNNTIGNENPPTSGDLKHTTNILSQIVGLGASKNATVDSEKFGDVLNSVLDTNNSGSWNEVNTEEQSDEGASKIMGIVESLGSLVQKNLLPNETKIINKTNLVIEVSTMKKNLTFPPDSNSISKLILADQPFLQDTLYTAALYRTLSGILPTTPNRSVGSDVISVSFGQDIDILTENITIRFEQNKKVPFTDPKISCGYWNFSARSWANSGCYLKKTESNVSVSTCTCNHLTNFAILMSPNDFELTYLHQRALEIITFVGCGLSILGCSLTLITYYAFWRYVKNEWTVILFNMCVVLIIGYSVFLSSTNVTDNEIACIIVTAVLHYVFLVVFFLMLCEGISVARSVTVVFKRKSEVRFYLPFAWGVPLVIVGITLGVTRLKGYHSEKYCWLSTNKFVFMAFVGPALLIILINIGIIHVVLKAIYSTNAMVNERLKKKVRAGVKCMVILIPVLGLSWLFGILAYNEDTIIFQYLFGISTSLQGFIIFIRDAVSNKKLHEGIRKAMHRYRSNSMLKASSKTQSSGIQNRFDLKGNQWSAVKYPYDKPMRAHLKMRTFI